MKIVVIGAGIVGLTTSYWLARDGHAVTVVDRCPSVGQGASFANGGQLSYDYVAPLASPAVLGSLPRWLISGDSPVKFRPAADSAQLLWAFSFLLACTARRSRRTTESLLALGQFSRQALDELVAEERLEFSHRRNGKIVFYSDTASFAGAVRQQAMQAELGSRQSVLGRDECIDLEPSLKQSAARIVGAIYTPSEELGDCHALCRALQRRLAQPPYAVRFALGMEIEGFVGEAGAVRAARTRDGVLEADLYVLCAGTESRRLARTLGIRLPLYPIRGYSISPPIVDAERPPEKSITDYQHRIVYARIGGVLRVAGFADILAPGSPIDGSRIAGLGRAAGALFPGACNLAEPAPWAGDRPATPSGIPIIGHTAWSNLLVNVGQGALGFTLGAGSGRMLADIVAGRRAGLDTSEFGLPAARRARVRGEAPA